MRSLIFSLLLIFIALGNSLKANEAELELANSFNHTGMFIYYIMEKSQNTIISPLSINASILVAYMGAKGETAKELAQALHLTLPRKKVASAYASLSDHLTGGDEKILISNSMWVGNHIDILRSYKSTVESDFNGTIHNVNFTQPQGAAYQMNQWISDKSFGKIKKFIDPSSLTHDTKMVLLNALFLKGSWENPFPTQSTGSKPFLKGQGGSVLCKMMQQQSELYYFENDDTQVIALPIEGLNGRLSFVVFLPKKRSEDLYNFYYAQDESKPEGFLSYLQFLKKREVDLSLPKFIVSQKLNLIPIFRSLGIHAALSNQADFSLIDGKKDLMISQAAHESLLSIDEGGIFATAASGLSFSLKSHKGGSAIPMVVNRPFLYAVIDFDTKFILFLGECQDPTQSGIVEISGGQDS